MREAEAHPIGRIHLTDRTGLRGVSVRFSETTIIHSKRQLVAPQTHWGDLGYQQASIRYIKEEIDASWTFPEARI